MYPTLPKSYKGFFPFKIGTTSYIHPDGYAANVAALGPYLEEIELLLFESLPKASLPDGAEISALGRLAKKHRLTYNVHLPIDIYLGADTPALRNQAIASIIRIFRLVSPLSPTSCTLHLNHHRNNADSTQLKIWQQHIYTSLSQLITAGLNAADITIENLDYPFDWLAPLFSDFDFRVCLDFGHIFRYNQNPDIIFDNYGDRISLIHLNGFDADRDHVSLESLSPNQLDQIMQVLKTFTGSVSVEVFSFDDLQSSLNLLETCWQNSARFSIETAR